MLKNSNLFAISGIKKVASLLLVLSLLTLVGCGSDNDSHESKITTEEYTTEAEEKLAVDEPNQEIDDGAVLPDATTEADTTEEATEEKPAVNNGSYSYTIYDGIEVTLPFDIEDYIITNSTGDWAVLFNNMATDCGWVSLDEEHATDFYYDCGDYYTYFSLEYPYDEEFVYPKASDDYKVHQIKSCELWFSPPSEPDKYYYESGPAHTEKSCVELNFGMHYSDCQYLYAGAKTSTALSKDDAIMLAYLLTFTSNNPNDGNPLYYLDLKGTNIGLAGAWTEYTFD